MNDVYIGTETMGFPQDQGLIGACLHERQDVGLVRVELKCGVAALDYLIETSQRLMSSNLIPSLITAHMVQAETAAFEMLLDSTAAATSAIRTC